MFAPEDANKEYKILSKELSHPDASLDRVLLLKSPQAHHLHVVGMLQFMSDINQRSLCTPFSTVLASVSVFMALAAVFHSTNSPDNSPFSDSVLPVLSLCLIGPFNFMSLYESLL